VEKVTITIEGTADEVRESIEKLAGVGAGTAPNIAKSLDWSEAEVKVFWDSISTNMGKLCQALAKAPGGLDTAELASILGLSVKGVGGVLSSQGYAMRHHKGKPKPVDWDESGKLHIRADVAEVIKGW